MIKDKRITIAILTVSFLVFLNAVVGAEEPTRPAVDNTFDSKKEAKIQELTSLSIREAFNRLKGIDFFVNEDLLHKAIFSTFKYRRKEAIDFGINYLKLPVREIIDGKLVSRGDDFYVAKKILHVFPDGAVDSLLDLYSTGDAVAKGNVIRVAGKMAGGQAIRSLLIEALDDKSFCEERYPEMLGEPLRICDVAYNQIVLRYMIRNVLRTIGTAHRIEIRDYHINILKSSL